MPNQQALRFWREFGKGAGSNPEGSFNDASFATDVAGQVEDRGLALA